jgi:hypothetical protein
VAYDWRFWVPVTCAALSVVWFALLGVSLLVSPPMVTSEVAWATTSSDGSSSSGTKTVVEPLSFSPSLLDIGVVLFALFAVLGAAAREWGLVAVIGAGLVIISLFDPYHGLLYLPAEAALFLSATLGAALE